MFSCVEDAKTRVWNSNRSVSRQAISLVARTFNLVSECLVRDLAEAADSCSCVTWEASVKPQVTEYLPLTSEIRLEFLTPGFGSGQASAVSGI